MRSIDDPVDAGLIELLWTIDQQREAELLERIKDFEQEEDDLREREQHQRDINAREASVTWKEENITRREAAVTRRKESATRREVQILAEQRKLEKWWKVTSRVWIVLVLIIVAFSTALGVVVSPKSGGISVSSINTTSTIAATTATTTTTTASPIPSLTNFGPWIKAL